MSHIRSKDTTPECKVRKELFRRGLRYRKHVKKLPGTPDMVFPKYKTIVFVNGCFWHHHDCKYFHWPKSNAEFWKNKITRNEERDAKNKTQLQELGWNVITVWECELKKDKFQETLDSLYSLIVSNG